MALVSSVDYVNKKIYLGIASVGVTLDTLDIYREVRNLRRLDTSTPYYHRYFLPMVEQGGNIQKTATTYTAPYCILKYGCEIIPYDADQTITIIRDTFTDDGRSGAQCFNTTGFTNVVNFVEAVDKIEVRQVNISGSTAPTVQQIRAEIDDNSIKLNELHRIQGLDINNPATVTPDLVSAGTINIELTGDGESLTIMTRQ